MYLHHKRIRWHHAACKNTIPESRTTLSSEFHRSMELHESRSQFHEIPWKLHDTPRIICNAAIALSNITSFQRTSRSPLYLPLNLEYKWHLSRRYNCWSLRCNWSILIINLTTVFSRLGKDKGNRTREAFNFWDLLRLIFYVWRNFHLIDKWANIYD